MHRFLADGNQESIKIASSHVYTVAAADENGVTLISPARATTIAVAVAAGQGNLHDQLGRVLRQLMAM